MPTLPTFENLGPRPSSRSPRSIVGARTGMAAREAASGYNQLAASTDRIGATLDAASDKIAREEAEREARDLDVEYSDSLRVILHGTEENPGYLGKYGEHAINDKKSHVDALDALYEKSMAKASSQRVRDLITRSFNARRQSALDRSAVHFSAQRTAVNDASFTARQKSIFDEAAESPEKAAEFAGLAYDQAFDYYTKKGYSEVAAQEKAEFTATAIHMQEITRLNAIDADQARAYYNKAKANGEIDGSQFNAIENTLKGGEVKQWAYDNAAKISGEGGPLAEQLAKARKLAPTRAKADELVARVKTRFQEQEASDDLARRGRVQGLTENIEANGFETLAAKVEFAKETIEDPKDQDDTIAALVKNDTIRRSSEASEDKARFDAASEKAVNNEDLTEADLKGLSATQRRYVEKAKQEAELVEADPDYLRVGDGGKTWEKFVIDSASVREFASLTPEEVKGKYEFGVTKHQYENIILPEYRAALQAVGKGTTEKAGASGMTELQRIANTAQRVGIDKKKDQDKFVAWQTEYDRRVIAEGAVKWADKQKILDQMSIEKVVYDQSDTWVSFDDEKLFSLLSEDEKMTFAKDADIPEDQREIFVQSLTAITDSLRRQGVPVNRANILTMWNVANKNAGN